MKHFGKYIPKAQDSFNPDDWEAVPIDFSKPVEGEFGTASPEYTVEGKPVIPRPSYNAPINLSPIPSIQTQRLASAAPNHTPLEVDPESFQGRKKLDKERLEYDQYLISDYAGDPKKYEEEVGKKIPKLPSERDNFLDWLGESADAEGSSGRNLFGQMYDAYRDIFELDTKGRISAHDTEGLSITDQNRRVQLLQQKYPAGLLGKENLAANKDFTLAEDWLWNPLKQFTHKIEESQGPMNFLGESSGIPSVYRLMNPTGSYKHLSQSPSIGKFGMASLDMMGSIPIAAGASRIKHLNQSKNLMWIDNTNKYKAMGMSDEAIKGLGDDVLTQVNKMDNFKTYLNNEWAKAGLIQDISITGTSSPLTVLKIGDSQIALQTVNRYLEDILNLVSRDINTLKSTGALTTVKKKDVVDMVYDSLRKENLHKKGYNISKDEALKLIDELIPTNIIDDFADIISASPLKVGANTPVEEWTKILKSSKYRIIVSEDIQLSGGNTLKIRVQPESRSRRHMLSSSTIKGNTKNIQLSINGPDGYGGLSFVYNESNNVFSSMSFSATGRRNKMQLFRELDKIMDSLPPGSVAFENSMSVDSWNMLMRRGLKKDWQIVLSRNSKGEVVTSNFNSISSSELRADQSTLRQLSNDWNANPSKNSLDNLITEANKIVDKVNKIGVPQGNEKIPQVVSTSSSLFSASRHSFTPTSAKFSQFYIIKRGKESVAIPAALLGVLGLQPANALIQKRGGENPAVY